MEFRDDTADSDRTITKKEIIDKLEGVDFQAAADNIAYTFRYIARKGESEGGHYIMKKEMMDAIDYYMGDPCFERAITLLEKYPSCLEMFELTKDPLQIRARNFKKSKE